MKIIALIVAALLTGCTTTVPTTTKFPQAPKELKEKCSELKTLEGDAKLSDVAKTITQNYTEYHKCSMKVDSWTEWYEKQKKLYEKIK